MLTLQIITNMKKVIIFVFIFCTLFLSACFDGVRDARVDMTPRLIVAQDGLSTVDVVENVKGAVVGIACFSSSGTSVGSGVAIANGGYVLTNHHVVGGAKTIVVYYADKTQGSAKFVWSDSSLDLAIIQTEKNMPYLQCGTSKDLKVGQDILAIGTPLTLQFKHTVTKGIVSALNRTLEVGSLQDAVYLQNLIQHDASINPGNSGGPLISLDCKLVGINTLKAESGEGIGFAIPIEVGKAISTQIVANHNFAPAYIGLFGFDSSIASFYNETTAETGVFVLVVDENSPAKNAGLQKGDVVVALGEKQIETVLDLKVALYEYQAGQKINVKVFRDGKEMSFELKATKR